MDKETEKEAAKEIAIAQLNKRNTETVEVVFPSVFARRLGEKDVSEDLYPSPSNSYNLT